VIHGADNRKPSLFQPLIVGLFCLLLALLFFAAALMDVRRTQNTLLEVFENKGMTIIETVEMMAQDKLKGLMGITNRAATSFQDLQNMEEGFQIQEMILTRLIEFGREVERRGEGGRLAKEELEALSLEAGIRATILYDAHKEAILQSAPVPKQLAPRLKRLLEGSNEIALDIQCGEPGENAAYLVGVRGKYAEGMVVLVFGQEALQAWASRAAIQAAVEEGGWRKGIHYFMVVDSRGRLLAGAGDLVEADADGEAPYDVEQIRGKGSASSRRIIKGSPELLEVQAPLQLNGRKAGIARIGMEIDEVIRLRERNQAHIFFSTGLMMMGAVLAELLFYRIQARHLRKIQEMKERLIQAERLSSLGRLAAGVAHEIRNPLNAVSMAIQRIHREFAPSEPESKKAFSHIVTVVREEIRRLDRIVEDFVGPARMKPTEFRPERLVDLLDRVVHLAREEAGSRDIRIECHWEDPDLTVYMDPARMHQAVFNLIKNAMEAMPEGGTIAVAAQPRGSHDAVVTIRDTGVGIPAEVVQRILDFSTPPRKKVWGSGCP
jgi:signal transduction histidine kinase